VDRLNVSRKPVRITSMFPPPHIRWQEPGTRTSPPCVPEWAAAFSWLTRCRVTSCLPGRRGL
jgi:hypothetical protein